MNQNDEFDEYRIRLMNLPVWVNGFCYHDDDGNCYVILNARLTRELNGRSYLHELRHIFRGEMDDPGYNEYGKETSA